MNIQVLKSKIHELTTVTEANIDYIGSITIDENLMDATNLIENEQYICSTIEMGSYYYLCDKGQRGSGL